MSARLACATLVSAVLLCSYSAAIAADVRPEVGRPLDEARVLANGWADRAAIMAKLNQAASIPDLNKAEQDKIRAVTIYALARAGHGGIPGTESGMQPSRDTAQSSINSTWPYR